MKGKARSALKVAKAAEAQAAAHRETPATKQQRVAELEERCEVHCLGSGMQRDMCLEGGELR